MRVDRLPEQHGGRVAVEMSASLGLGHDAVDHAELEAVRSIGLEGGGRLLRLRRVTPQDCRAALG